jgi:Zn-dependent M28 family amino/carboxypeptidase
LRHPVRAAFAAACLGLLALTPVAPAATAVDSTQIRALVTPEGAMTHLHNLQNLATANPTDGVPTRAAGTIGYEKSLQYVESVLAPYGGYFNVYRDEFEFDDFTQTGTATLSRVTPEPATAYTLGTDFEVMDYSGSGSLTNATVVPVGPFVLPPTGGSASGCALGDFPVPPNTNSVALIQRGTCDFGQKAVNAATAGYKAAIIFNEGNEVPDDDRVGLLFGTLGDYRPDIPTLGTTHALGIELMTAGATVNLSTATEITENVQSYNLVADTLGGRTDRTVVAGGHLDSVHEGPGIQDNGSGSAANLETALQMAKNNLKPRNRVRFMWFGAEEAGLIGSQAYVDGLSARELKSIAVMLNFDMIASPNYGRFIYDGDASDTDSTASAGSGVVESVFTRYFAGLGLGTAPTAFDGRSDYDAFAAAGVPAGGLFTGAEDPMTDALAAIFQIDDAVVGQAFDPCYHAACDDISNIDVDALAEMVDAVAHGVWTFAQTTSAPEGTDKGKTGGKYSPDHKGEHLRK